MASFPKVAKVRRTSDEDSCGELPFEKSPGDPQNTSTNQINAINKKGQCY
jgi:hypothetical protein